MTREEAINAFKEWIERDKKIEYVDRLENIEIYKLAIKALEQTEPEKCGDCISRQDLLNAIFQKEYGHDYDENTDILNLKYVDIINGMPSVEPEKCGDCISRRAIIGKCEDTAKATSESGEMNTGFIMALDFIADYAKHMPSVEPERKPGKWINIDGSTNSADCSCCGNRGRAWMNYCYECGSTMKGGIICNAED